MIAAIGKFIFPEAPYANRQTIPFALDPNDYKQPGKFIWELLALQPQRFDAKDAALVNRASQGDAASRVTHIFQAGSLRELEPRFIDPGDFHPRVQQEPFALPAFARHFGSCFCLPFSGGNLALASFSPWSNRAPTVEPRSLGATHMIS